MRVAEPLIFGTLQTDHSRDLPCRP